MGKVGCARCMASPWKLSSEFSTNISTTCERFRLSTEKQGPRQGVGDAELSALPALTAICFRVTETSTGAYLICG
jgi:hypothetical protein